MPRYFCGLWSPPDSAEVVHASTLMFLSGLVVGLWSTSHQFQMTIFLPCARTVRFMSLMKSTNTSDGVAKPCCWAYWTSSGHLDCGSAVGYSSVAMWNSGPLNNGANSLIRSRANWRASGLVTSRVEPAMDAQEKPSSGLALIAAAAWDGISISGMMFTWYRRAAASNRRMSSFVYAWGAARYGYLSLTSRKALLSLKCSWSVFRCRYPSCRIVCRM